MYRRLITAALAAVSVSTALGLGGCASVSRGIAPRPVGDNPLIVPSNDFEAIWRETVTVLDEYFDVRTENRLARSIVTDPMVGATLLEPWRPDSVGFHNKLESTMQTIR